jgi:hypothetical protein
MVVRLEYDLVLHPETDARAERSPHQTGCRPAWCEREWIDPEGRSATGARNRHRIEDGKEVPPVNGLLVHQELNDSIQLSAMDGE